MTPRISVVVPACNAGRTIERTVRAICNQTIDDWEVLVVDDGSVDGTPEIARVVDDERISVSTTLHAGVSAARNQGIARSSAPIVTFVDADDVPHADWLERMLEPFDTERVGIACCRMVRVSEDGAEHVLDWRQHPTLGSAVGPTLFLAGSFAVRRELLVDGYDERLAFGENTELSHRLLLEVASRGQEVALITETLVTVHTSGDRSDARDAARLEAVALILENHRPTMPPHTVALHERIVAINAARIGHLQSARRHATRAWRLEPLRLAAATTLAGTWLPQVGDRWSRPSSSRDLRNGRAETTGEGAGLENGAPRVSVLMPVYNGSATVAAAIDSILAQTFHGFELIVVDDGSTDGTADVVDLYRADPRLRVVTSPTNEGLVPALTRGLSHCRGELVARLDADDLASPTRLERQVVVFDRDRRVVLCAAAVDRVSEDGRLMKHSSPPVSHAELAAAMLVGNRIHHSSVMFRRDAVTRVGGYDPDWFPVEDYDLWLRLLDLGMYAGLGTTETVYLQREDGISAGMSDQQSQLAAERAALYRSGLTGRSPGVGRVGATVEIARAGLSLRRRLRRRRLASRGLERRALRAANQRLRADGRLARALLVLLLAPRIAVLGRLQGRDPGAAPSR